MLISERFTCSYSSYNSTKGYSSECHSPECRGLLGLSFEGATTFRRMPLSQITLGAIWYYVFTLNLSHFPTILLSVVLLNVVALLGPHLEGAITFRG
jgi:hypothetical protein